MTLNYKQTNPQSVMHTEINPHGHRTLQLKYYAVEWKYSYKCDNKNTSCTFVFNSSGVHAP